MIRILNAVTVVAIMSFFSFHANPVDAQPVVASSAKETGEFPPGWKPTAHRDETRPQFSYEAQGGPRQRGAFVMTSSESIGENPWKQRVC